MKEKIRMSRKCCQFFFWNAEKMQNCKKNNGKNSKRFKSTEKIEEKNDGKSSTNFNEDTQLYLPSLCAAIFSTITPPTKILDPPLDQISEK